MRIGAGPFVAYLKVSWTECKQNVRLFMNYRFLGGAGRFFVAFCSVSSAATSTFKAAASLVMVSRVRFWRPASTETRIRCRTPDNSHTSRWVRPASRRARLKFSPNTWRKSRTGRSGEGGFGGRVTAAPFGDLLSDREFEIPLSWNGADRVRRGLLPGRGGDGCAMRGDAHPENAGQPSVGLQRLSGSPLAPPPSDCPRIGARHGHPRGDPEADS